MKRVCSILIVACVVAITEAYIVEYSEQALEDSFLTDPQGDLHFLATINFPTKLGLLMTASRVPNEAEFESHILDGSAASPDPVCGYHHGINFILNNEYFCNIATFRMNVVGSINGPQTMSFLVLFQRQPMGSVYLKVPVFQIPSRIPRVRNDEDLKAWAGENAVSLETPFDGNNLLVAQGQSLLIMDLLWLDRLLVHHIYKRLGSAGPSTGEPEVPTYVTRPLLLPKNLLDGCLQTIEAANQGDRVESAGSNTQSVDDDDDDNDDGSDYTGLLNMYALLWPEE